MESKIFMILVTVAISVISYFLKRQVTTNDSMKSEIDDLKVRVAVNENDVSNTNKLLAAIQSDLKYVVRRVDDIARGG